MNNLTEIRPISLREQIVEKVRAAIISGQLRPGDHVVEAYLTKQLGVSRTPVREALILLEREGLLVSLPHKGTFVRRYSAADVNAIFSIRTNLENFAAELTLARLTKQDLLQLEQVLEEHRRAIDEGDTEALRGLDMAFHDLLMEKSSHPFVIRYWSEIAAQLAALLHHRAEAFPEYDESQVLKDHGAIIEAYAARDLDKIKQLNADINGRVSNECQKALEQLGFTFPPVSENLFPHRKCFVLAR